MTRLWQREIMEDVLNPQRPPISMEAMHDQIRMLWELNDTLNDTLGEKLVRLEMALNRFGYSNTVESPMPLQAMHSINARMTIVESLIDQLHVENMPENIATESGEFSKLRVQELALMVESLNERVRRLERDA